uniref:Translocation protein SEC62 n=1 Tax=Globodera rostochiensis TaxID=31243 RepID=A0A914H5W3_GLORO
MAERKKKKDKNAGKKGGEDGGDSNKLTKEEDSIARFVRFNCPTNSTMFEGNEVHYFSGKKAVDVLVESKKYGAVAKIPKFLNSGVAEEFLQTLLEKGLFVRAKKLVPKKKEKPSSDQPPKAEKGGLDVNKSPPSGAKSAAEKRRQKEGVEEDEERTKAEDDGAKGEEEDEEKREQQEEEKKKKKKVKILLHDVQTFDVNSNDVYVWIFDPTPLWKKCVGILIVLGTIGGCLFPLWPDWLRLGIYYLSVTGIALFGLLLGVAFARTVLFGFIWLCTLGRHRLWLLPNLLEECGFFESFQPTYTYEYIPGGIFAKKDPKCKKKKDDSKKEEQGNDNKDEDEQKDGMDGVGIDIDDKTPLISQEEREDAKLEPEHDISPPPSAASLKEEEACHPTQADRAELERNSSSAESESQHSSSKKDGTSGSEEEDVEGAQTGTDDSNSWEKLSENSQRSSAECGKKKE